MLYKPRFCCHCGQKITRIEWNLLTSRRFCEVCAVENQGSVYLQRGVIGIGLLGIVFGIGSLFGSSNVERTSQQTAPSVLLKSAVPAGKDVPQTVSLNERTVIEPANTAPPKPTEPEQKIPQKEMPKAAPVYYCGAMTKKGTACSRRVKAAGDRCFQHEGKPSALPEN